MVPEKILQSGHQLAPNIRIGCLEFFMALFTKPFKSLTVYTFPSYGFGNGIVKMSFSFNIIFAFTGNNRPQNKIIYKEYAANFVINNTLSFLWFSK